LKAFSNFSHPLRLRGGGNSEEINSICYRLRSEPPRFIILDGYTEKTYFKRFIWLDKFLEERYRMLTVVLGSKFPVTIYELVT
jgi:hypothetical protein